ncbi:MAG: hypothetical protein H7Y12_01885, partial [Sphingobacteriaceae bacterium]|nr:hypothetical protein [Cytophagaceae bacterium]
MHKLRLFTTLHGPFAVALFFAGTSLAQSVAEPKSLQLNGSTYEIVNRDLSPLAEAGKPGVRFSAGEGAGLAWLTGRTFSEGTIEFDVRGKDVFQRS